jgi:release factor glutamine methyltransferase
MTTVGEALAQACAMGIDRLDAQLLVARRLDVTRTWLLAHDEATLPDEQARACAADFGRRADGVPVAYLVGSREFHGLNLTTTPAALVPRPDTEILVDWALELLMSELAGARDVIDLGTGSGAIALAVKNGCPRVNLLATDSDHDALALARANAERLQLQVEFASGDWWTAAGGRRFDLALSNPPYIAAADPHLAALRHEPLSALTAGEDGLAAIRRLVAGAPKHLKEGGWLLLEHGFDQEVRVGALLKSHGFVSVSTRFDFAGLPRCSGGRRNPVAAD